MYLVKCGYLLLGNKVIKGAREMFYIVDFKNVSTVGLESSPVAETIAGLRANEARYFMNKYKHEFTVASASHFLYLVTPFLP
jgi:hypothetical protein